MAETPTQVNRFETVDQAIALIRKEPLQKAEFVGDLFDMSQALSLHLMDRALHDPDNFEIKGLTDQLAAISAQVGQEKLENLLRLQDLQGVDPASEENFALLEAAALREQIARKIIRSVVASEHAPDFLSDTGKVYLEYGTQIQDVMDRLSIKLRREVLQGAAFKRLQRIQKEYEADTPEAERDPSYAFEKYVLEPHMKGHGDFLYVVPKVVSDRVDEKPVFETVPYAEAFPEEIAEIADLMGKMIDRFEELQAQGKGDVNTEGLIDIHKKLRALLTSTGNAEDQEKLGVELDQAFVRHTNKTGVTMTLIPPMEAYLDPWSMLVEMEYDIAFVDERHKPLNDECDKARDDFLGYLRGRTDLQDFPVLEESMDSMQRSSAKFYAMLRSGNSYKSLASNIPNRAGVKLVEGLVVDMDYSSFVEKMEISKELIAEAFKADLTKTDTTIKRQAIAVGLHEVGHNIFVVKDTIKRLSNYVYANLEEAKSDLVGLIGGLHFFREDITRRKEFILAELCQNLRGLSRWQDRGDRTHFNGNTLILGLLMDAGIIYADGDRWVFEPTDDKIDDLFKKAEAVLPEFAEAYQAPDDTLGLALLKRRFSEEADEKLKPLAEAAGIDTRDRKAA